MSVNGVILRFRDLILQAWPSILSTFEHLDWDQDPYFFDDWLQANWELLVERQILKLGQTLVPYGYGGSPENRYRLCDKPASHMIICSANSGHSYHGQFLCFASKSNGNVKISPPFDFANIKDLGSKEIKSVPVGELEFDVVPMS